MKFGIYYLSRVICKGSALFTRKRCAYTDFLNVKNVFILESQLQETMNHATECWFSWRAGRKQVANWLTMPMFVYFKLKKSRKMEENNLNGAQIYILIYKITHTRHHCLWARPHLMVHGQPHRFVVRHCIAQQILKCDLCVDMFVS